MAEGRESSVLFSLKSLMDIESDRVHAEERERAEQEYEALQRQRRLELEAERQRIIMEEQRRAREQSARDEEAARAASAKEAAIVRARIEAQAQAQREALEKEREHEVRMAAISEVSRRRRDRLLLIGSNGVLATILLAACGIYFGKLAPDMVQREAQLSHLVTAEGDRADVAERLARQVREEAGDLETELARMQSELREARSKLEERPRVEPPRSGPARTQRTVVSRRDDKPPCRTGDPLCEDPNMP